VADRSWELAVTAYDETETSAQHGRGALRLDPSGAAVQDVFIQPATRQTAGRNPPDSAQLVRHDDPGYDPNIQAWRVNWFNPHEQSGAPS